MSDDEMREEDDEMREEDDEMREEYDLTEGTRRNIVECLKRHGAYCSKREVAAIVELILADRKRQEETVRRRV